MPPPYQGWRAKVGPGGVSWNISFMAQGRQKLFLCSLLKTRDKNHIRKRKKSGVMCETSAELEGHPSIIGGQRLAGEGRLSLSAFVISLTGINRGQSVRGVNRGGSCPGASGISWPGGVWNSPRLRVLKYSPHSSLHHITATSQGVGTRVGRALGHRLGWALNSALWARSLILLKLQRTQKYKEGGSSHRKWPRNQCSGV